MAKARASSTFPKFDDADVEIRLSTNEQDVFHLHSVVLGLHSPILKTSLSERWSGPSKPAPGLEKGIQWTYELRFEPNQVDGILTRKLEHVSGESLDDTTTLFNPSSYSSNPDKVLQKLLMSRSVEAHRHLLMILYHMPFDISVEDFDTIRAPLKNLALTADMYGSYPLVGPHIDRQLLPFKSSETALKTCIDFPSELIEFAVLVRSDWIFKHTFVHLLSRPSVWNDHHTALDSMGLGSLFSRKAEAFLDDVKELALHFLTFPYESTNWPMKLAEYSLRSISAELYRTINERNCTTFRWIQIVRFLATSNDLRLKTTELPNLVEGKHTQREISLIEKSIKCHILASKCCTTLFLANPTNVDTMCQPGAGTNIAPLVCFEITDDDLPWKNASS